MCSLCWERVRYATDSVNCTVIGTDRGVERELAISRLDHNNTHGFQVRVVRRGVEHSKMFSDGVHGSRELAHERAKEYEAKLIRELPPVPRERFKPQANNSSGIVGVTKSYAQHRKGSVGGSYYWQTTFIDLELGKPRNIKFSVNKYGEEEAKERAILCRIAKDNIFTKTGRRKKKYKDLQRKSIIVRKEGKLMRKGSVQV